MLQRIELGLVYPSKKARPINEDSVISLMESMEKIGLKTPITVRPSKNIRDGLFQDTYECIVGHHRREAALRLAWDTIDAFVEDLDDTTARLWEISENLHRAELTTLEKSKLIAEWVELVGGEKPAQVEQVSGGRGNKSGDSEASRQLNLSRGEVQRSKKIASLSPEAQRAAIEAGLDDNQSALIEAAKQETSEQQVQYFQRRQEMKLADTPKDDFEAREAWLASMMRLWNKAGQEWRQEFLKRI